MEEMKVFKWWWAWEYESIEMWLEDMAAKGLKLVRTSCGGVLFHFAQGKRTNTRYCIDYRPNITQDYLGIMKDDGWELKSVGPGWYICIKDYQGEDRPDLFNDYNDIIERNKRLGRLLYILGIPSLFLILWPVVSEFNRLRLASILGQLTSATLILLLYGYFGLKLSVLNRSLLNKMQIRK